jgi:hypothetical protein
VLQVLERKIPVRDCEGRRNVPLFEVMLLNVAATAVNGDPGAFKLLVELRLRHRGRFLQLVAGAQARMTVQRAYRWTFQKRTSRIFQKSSRRRKDASN